MKFLKISFLLLCCAMLLVACTKKPKAGFATVKLDDFFELKMAQSVAIADTDFKLTFTAVPEDSRCPKFVNCIQEGQVRVSITATIDGKAQVVEMARKPSDKGATTVTVGQYKIQLYDVMPYPENGKKIIPTDYMARMAVKKVG